MEKQKIEKQFELFVSAHPNSRRRDATSGGLNEFFKINLSLENIVTLTILCLMLIILAFSLGVERGKKHILKDLVTKQETTLSPEKKIVSSDKSSTGLLKKDNVSKEKQFADRAFVVQANTNVFLDKQDISSGRNISGYTIQVASLKKNDSAQKEVGRLKKMGFEAWARPSGEYYILCVGTFSSKKDAELFQKKLLKIFDDCLIRRL